MQSTNKSTLIAAVLAASATAQFEVNPYSSLAAFNPESLEDCISLARREVLTYRQQADEIPLIRNCKDECKERYPGVFLGYREDGSWNVDREHPDWWDFDQCQEGCESAIYHWNGMNSEILKETLYVVCANATDNDYDPEEQCKFDARTGARELEMQCRVELARDFDYGMDKAVEDCQLDYEFLYEAFS